MRLCAIVNNLVVVRVESLSDDVLQSVSAQELVIDIQDMVPQPSVGWQLSGNTLLPPVLDAASKVALVMEMRFKFGNDLADSMVKKMSIRNLELITIGQTLNINTVISTFAGIEAALRKCAIPTAKAGINSMIAAYPEYTNEFSFAISEINNFLAKEALL